MEGRICKLIVSSLFYKNEMPVLNLKKPRQTTNYFCNISKHFQYTCKLFYITNSKTRGQTLQVQMRRLIMFMFTKLAIVVFGDLRVK